MTKSKVFLFVCTALYGFAIASPAYAYLDPGTGSMLLQLMLGGVAGLLVIVKLYFHKLTGFFRFNSNSAEIMASETQEKDNDSK
ncbi:MAG: hypothetical protein K9G33_12560 [Sneathiella sp.]|nr:hypothetical protein [Sneathiella sp.]